MDGIRSLVLNAFILFLMICLAGAPRAFAQGQNAVLTGTVTDNAGVVPGATVVATDPTTGLVRSAESNEQGVFRVLSLPAGRYSVRIEMAGFRQINLNDIQLVSGETRDLGRLVLEVGTLAEAVTVSAEVTPVNTTTGSLQRNMTGDQLTMIQVKGRDIFGMMKILPGVSDTTFSRDYAAWQSGRGLSINGGTSLNKNTTIDGVSVGEEGGDGTTHVTPNLDSIGEVTVITNGYTAENGRQSSGLIRIVTKSGTNQLKGSAWYNARRDEWNANDYFRKKQGAEKPFFEVDISGYSIGGPVVIPGLIDSRSGEKKMFFFFSQEFVDDVRPTAVLRTNLPTDAERRGDFSQTRMTNGTIQPIIDPLTGQAFPGNIIPQNRIHPMGQQMLNLLPLPNGVINQASGQQFTSNDAQDTTPIHKRRNFIMRIDGVLSPSQRLSVRSILDRDDSITYNRVAPGVGSHNNVFPGDFVSGSHSKVLSSSMVNEMSARLLAQPLWFQSRHREARDGGLHLLLPFELPVRSATTRAVRAVRRSEAESHQRRRIPLHARHPLPWWQSLEPRAMASMGRKHAAGADLERELPLHVPERPLVDQGSTQPEVRVRDGTRQPRRNPGRQPIPACTTSGTAATIRSARATAMRTRCSATSRGTKSGPIASIASAGTGRPISMRRTAGA